MAYRVCKTTGVIHASGENFKKICKNSTTIQKANYQDCRSKDEAEAIARKHKKQPRYCKICDFRDALQAEADR